jgi:hypothetical protein
MKGQFAMKLLGEVGLVWTNGRGITLLDGVRGRTALPHSVAAIVAS